MSIAITLGVQALVLLTMLLFRGALLGVMLRKLGENPLGIALSILLVSGGWALLHLPNTDSATFKVAQIFLIGVVLSETMRRFGLVAAMVIHAALNIFAVTGGALLFSSAL